jgi:hypothetical protein
MSVENLYDVGLLREKRESIKTIFNILAKSDFWHDFDSNLMQDLLENVSLTSSLSFAQRGTAINTIRTSLKGNPSVVDYFLSSIDRILPSGNEKQSFLKEKDLLTSLKLNFGEIADALKKWNESGDKIESIPLNFQRTPTYERYSRNYSINAVPVKIRGQNYFLPAAFKKSTGMTNFILMIDASHLSMTEIAASKLLDYTNNEYSATDTYNFFIVESNENDSDPATKILEVKLDVPNINIYFLKDEGHKSIFPTFLMESENGNLYSEIGLETVRLENNKIQATLSGKVNTVISDLGDLSEISNASQKAVDLLVENKGVINEEALSVFLLKRAGDWCQALCLLDRVRKYKIYKLVEETVMKRKGPVKKVVRKPSTIKLGGSDKSEVSLQDLLSGIPNIYMALLTFDRILLTFALLLGLNVFFTTKYANLSKTAPGVGSIHWLLSFTNTDLTKLDDKQKLEIINNASELLGSSIEYINQFTGKEDIIDALKGNAIALFQPLDTVKNFSKFISNICKGASILTINTPKEEFISLIAELTSLKETLESNLKTVAAAGVGADSQSFVPRDGVPDKSFLDLKSVCDNFLSINNRLYNINEQYEIMTDENYKYPNQDIYESILSKITERIFAKTNIDFRKEICYNNFLENIVSTFKDKLESIKDLVDLDLFRDTEVKLEYFAAPGKNVKTSRTQGLLLKILTDAVSSMFPKAQSGGMILPFYTIKKTEGMTEEELTRKIYIHFINMINNSFYNTRRRQIIPITKKNQKIKTFAGGDDNVLTAIRGSYVTDQNGNYFSVVDRFLITNDEKDYFFDFTQILPDDEESESKSKYEKDLINIFQTWWGLSPLVKSDGSRVDHWRSILPGWQYRYLVARQRLLNLDNCYTKYRALRTNYFAGLRNDETLSDSLSIEFEKLNKDIIDIEVPIYRDFRNPSILQPSIESIADPVNKLKNLQYRISQVRAFIFQYIKKYYTKKVEDVFEKYEVAEILSDLGTEIVKRAKTVSAESDEDKEILEILRTIKLTPAQNVVEEKKLSADTLAILADANAEEQEDLKEVIIDKTVEESVIGILAAKLRSAGGGRKLKRKTHKKKKSSAKRKTRKQ